MPRQRRSGSRPSHEITEQILLDDRLAKKTVEKLTQRGVPRSALLPLVLCIPRASDDTDLVDGMTEYKLWSLPSKIEALADEIGKVNGSPYFALDLLLDLDPRRRHAENLPEPLKSAETRESAELILKFVSIIPALLRFYGEHLRTRLKSFRPTGSHKEKRIPLQKFLTIRLMRLIEDWAGQPCYAEVATLLEAAYRASGNAKTIDPEGLRKLRENNPELSLIAHFVDLGR
jgi:hypothetical protein